MFLSDKISLRKNYSRIISLVPSQTELLSYLGMEDEVVGITKFCIHPDRWYRNKTKIGGTKKINFNAIQKLSPDLIIVNKEENVKEQVEALAEKYDVWMTDVNNLSNALIMIKDIGKLVKKTDEATGLRGEILAGFETLKKEFQAKRTIPAAYFIWQKPYMVAGGDTFINEMMRYCGLKNVFSDHARYPAITLDQIKEKNTELILLSSEPYPFREKHKDEIQKGLPGISVELTDGEMFSWYGSRLLKSVDYFHSFLNIL